MNLPPDCLNLGQGYMNFSPPTWVREAAEEALKVVAANHYSHPKGRIRLRQALKKYYDPSFNRSLDVENEIIVTSGANEGLSKSHNDSIRPRDPYPTGQYSVFTAFLNPGDEVILFEPYFDQYLASVTLNGGVPVYVPLHPTMKGVAKPTGHDWKFDVDEFRFVFLRELRR